VLIFIYREKKFCLALKERDLRPAWKLSDLDLARRVLCNLPKFAALLPCGPAVSASFVCLCNTVCDHATR
jgi:hypothetical protein